MRARAPEPSRRGRQRPAGRWSAPAKRLERALEDLARYPQASCLLSDFDGTLAPIVDDPAKAQALPGAVDSLHRCARRLGRVAVVSGRPVDFLADALELGRGRSPLDAYGLYGAEHLGADGAVHRAPAASASHDLFAVVAAELRAELPARVGVEPKSVSCVVHWRTAPELAGIALGRARAAAERHGLDLRPGKMAAELAAPGAPDKGDVARDLAGRAAVSCFLGDDVGDIPAFRALGELARSPGRRTWRLAVTGPESPDELLELADATLAGPAAACGFLAHLAESLDPTS